MSNLAGNHMWITVKARNVLRGVIQKYGPESAKKRIWNAEFSSGRWDFLEKTGDDKVHRMVEKYANNGQILDLGCGPGTTSIELDPGAYRGYTGVDISEVAVAKARARATEAGRAHLNQYYQSDIVTFEPAKKCDVIFFGDSIYYIPPNRIVPMLNRYVQYLTAQGIFITRMFDISGKRRYILDAIENNFLTVEKHLSEQDKVCLIAFRPQPNRKQ